MLSKHLKELVSTVTEKESPTRLYGLRTSDRGIVCSRGPRVFSTRLQLPTRSSLLIHVKYVFFFF